MLLVVRCWRTGLHGECQSSQKSSGVSSTLLYCFSRQCTIRACRNMEATLPPAIVEGTEEGHHPRPPGGDLGESAVGGHPDPLQWQGVDEEGKCLLHLCSRPTAVYTAPYHLLL